MREEKLNAMDFFVSYEADSFEWLRNIEFMWLH